MWVRNSINKQLWWKPWYITQNTCFLSYNLVKWLLQCDAVILSLNSFNCLLKQHIIINVEPLHFLWASLNCILFLWVYFLWLPSASIYTTLPPVLHECFFILKKATIQSYQTFFLQISYVYIHLSISKQSICFLHHIFDQLWGFVLIMLLLPFFFKCWLFILYFCVVFEQECRTVWQIPKKHRRRCKSGHSS